jgi:arsenate reductase
MTDKEIIETLLNYPILIERPILVSNNDAAIGRPPEHIKSIL